MAAADHTTTFEMVGRWMKRLTAATAIGLAVKDHEGRYCFTNSAYRAMHGVGAREIDGETDADLLPPTVAAARAEHEARVRATGASVRFDEVVVEGGGPVVTEVVLLEEPGVVGLFCMSTTRGDTQDRLLRLRRRMAEPKLTGPVGAYEVDLRTMSVAWSGAMHEIFGHPIGAPVEFETLMGQMAPDLQIVESEMADYLASPRPYSYVHRIRRLDGEIRMVHSRGSVIVDADGKPERLVGTDQDITHHLATEEQLERLFAFHERILESVVEAVCVVDRDGVVTFANSAALQQLDIKGELVGRPLEECLGRAARGPIRATLRDGQPRRVPSLVHRRDDGEERTLALLCAPIDDAGVREGAVVTLRDVTDRQRHEEQLRRSFAALDQANAHRERLLRALVNAQELERRSLATEVHDDPLQVMSAVRLGLDGLAPRLDGADRAAAERLRDEVLLATRRLRDMVFDLAQPALELGLAGAIEQYAREASREQPLDVRMRVELKEEPPMEARLVLYRIAQEALRNVVRHAHASQVSIDLHTTLDRLCLRIVDDGVGIGARDALCSRPGHQGVPGMRHRAAIAGGRCVVEPHGRGGTAVSVWMPLRPPPAGASELATALLDEAFE